MHPQPVNGTRRRNRTAMQARLKERARSRSRFSLPKKGGK